MTRINMNGIDRDMTAEEEAIYHATVEGMENDARKQRELEEAAEQAKRSAAEKFKALGLSDDEIAALVR